MVYAISACARSECRDDDGRTHRIEAGILPTRVCENESQQPLLRTCDSPLRFRSIFLKAIKSLVAKRVGDTPVRPVECFVRRLHRKPTIRSFHVSTFSSSASFLTIRPPYGPHTRLDRRTSHRLLRSHLSQRSSDSQRCSRRRRHHPACSALAVEEEEEEEEILNANRRRSLQQHLPYNSGASSTARMSPSIAPPSQSSIGELRPPIISPARSHRTSLLQAEKLHRSRPEVREGARWRDIHERRVTQRQWLHVLRHCREVPTSPTGTQACA